MWKAVGSGSAGWEVSLNFNFIMHVSHFLNLLKDGPLRSSEYFFVKSMLCDSKLNLYFVENIKQ